MGGPNAQTRAQVFEAYIADRRALADEQCYRARQRGIPHRRSYDWAEHCSEANPCPPCRALVEYATLRASGRA